MYNNKNMRSDGKFLCEYLQNFQCISRISRFRKNPGLTINNIHIIHQPHRSAVIAVQFANESNKRRCADVVIRDSITHLIQHKSLLVEWLECGPMNSLPLQGGPVNVVILTVSFHEVV